MGLSRHLVVAGLVAVLVVAGAGAALVGPEPPRATSDAEWSTPGAGNGTATGVSYFDGEAEFREYVQASQRLGSGGAPVARASGAAGGGDGGGGDAVAEQDATVETTGGTATAADTGGGGADTRVGTTNVQVAGVDEPDLVKTDGEHFFYAPRERYRVVRTTAVSGDGVARPEPRKQPNTTVIDIGDPAAPEVAAEINESGQLLQTGDSLVVLAPDELVGYDISDASAPERVWSHPLNGSLVAARLADDRLYVVTANAVDPADPCPVEPLGGAAPVTCTDIAHPETQIRADATYTVAAMDPATGAVSNATGLVGTRANTVVYADGEDLYLTYTERTDRTAVLTDYLLASDVLPGPVKAEVAMIRDTQPRDEQWRAVAERVREYAERSDREERAVYRELSDGLREYLGERKRTLTRTGVVRVELGGRLEVAAHGSVPGEPLNQFSLSAHNGTLRVATTIPGYGSAESENDLYTLEAESLDRQGSVTGMGEGQRVYAVRYVGETAYVVTFRQVDPLHVVDLSDPEEPVERGTLELPGFSTYLHPIDDDHVLGVGEEDGRVKAVLFDVSDPTDPVVDDNLRLEAGWSAVAGSHHAFTIDRRHEVFVLPAGQQALAVDYTDSSLDVERRVETAEPVTRARYVGDHLYVFAGRTVTVLDERGWDIVEKLPV
ncbi:beta-propeller domain-containing protein [Salinirussus salinus]|uniref:beta-propeller domain-containing protein n=1 Tax=Salinirussus salinus TaxID=1198300 RepID=UPI001359373F|nr:beta-propeller domain-containing protein [Salinirussus salinus]